PTFFRSSWPRVSKSRCTTCVTAVPASTAIRFRCRKSGVPVSASPGSKGSCICNLPFGDDPIFQVGNFVAQVIFNLLTYGVIGCGIDDLQDCNCNDCSPVGVIFTW